MCSVGGVLCCAEACTHTQLPTLGDANAQPGQPGQRQLLQRPCICSKANTAATTRLRTCTSHDTQFQM